MRLNNDDHNDKTKKGILKGCVDRWHRHLAPANNVPYNFSYTSLYGIVANDGWGWFVSQNKGKDK